PRLHFVGPAHDSTVVYLVSEAQRCLPRRLRGATISQVIFKATDEKGEPSCQLERFRTLPESKSLLLHLDHTPQPLLPFSNEVLGRLPRVLRTEFVDGKAD